MIEKIHLGKARVWGIEGLPNLKSIKVNKTAEKDYYLDEYFYWNSIAYCPSLRRIEIPESVRYVYTYDFSYLGHRGRDKKYFSPIKHVYLYSTNLKDGDLKDIPADTTFHVRNKKVSKKLRKFGFKGKILIEKNMK